MRSTRRAATTALGVLGILCTPGLGRAQSVPALDQPVSRIASINPGMIQGVVQDERGNPLAGAMVSALGATTKFAVTDKTGRFELRTLTPGPYLVQAHLTGFIASRAQIIEVRPSGRTSSSIALRHDASAPDASPAVLAAGLGGVDPAPGAGVAPAGSTNDDHGETAWRIRHARRGVLKDALTPEMIDAADMPTPDASVFGPMTGFGRAVASPARMASALFGATEFTGQVNLLTTGTFDAPQQLFTPDGFERSVAYVAVGAPVGSRADWSMHAALMQGDIASWSLAGSLVSRGAGPHRYDLGLSYATQRYQTGNPAALRLTADGSRNAGAVYGFDSWTLGRALEVTYGGRYEHYDYLDGRGLVSPRATITVAPASRTRLNATLSSRALAPGAEEFLAPSDDDLWLPPQRTFSPLMLDRTPVPERTNYSGIALERDLGASTIAIGAFREQVANQLVTLFDIDMPGRPATAAVGNYYISNSGDVDITGWSATWRAAVAGRVHGSVTYSLSRAAWNPTTDLAYMILFAPSAVRLESERVHDLTASVETAVPETATRVLVLYRVSNAFASRDLQAPGVDSRFDVQVRQSLPFMNFSSAQWEMLLAVRNFFRDASIDESLYDELLVVHPPKRIVGGLTLRF